MLVTNMFEVLGSIGPQLSRRLALWAALLGAFALGVGTGRLLAGARPFDWTLEIMELAFDLGLTIWFAVIASRRDKATSE